MKKSIIISGPQASGKTHIAHAIIITHNNSRVLRTNSHDVREKIEEGCPVNLIKDYSLIIIDGCTKSDIYEFNQNLPYLHSFNTWTGEPDDKHEKISIVYLTQEDIYYKDIPGEFHIINCRNSIKI